MAYGKIVVNKVNEKQLEQVTSLITELRNEKISILEYDDNKIYKYKEYYTDIISIAKEYKYQEDNEPFALFFPREYILADSKIDAIKIFKKYSDDPLIPKRISKLLNKLRFDSLYE